MRTRSSSRLSYERRVASSDLDEGGRRRRGEGGVKEEKEVFTRGLHKSVRGRGSRDGGKTAYEMFLEDDGPYSRKLYPPLTPGIKSSGFPYEICNRLICQHQSLAG